MNPPISPNRFTIPILSAAQLRAADALTVRSQGITSWELMERAGHAAADAIVRNIEGRLIICCGPGNNGGDGLGITRRIDPNEFGELEVWLLPAEKHSADWELMRRRIPDYVVVRELSADGEFPEIDKVDTVVDALFGTGLSRPLIGVAAQLVEHINRSEAEVISLDLPSGLPTDGPPGADAAIVRATRTLTFGAPKLPLLLPATAEYVGEWQLLDINLDFSQTDSRTFFTQPADLAPLLKPRARFGHKGSYGHALLLAGSRGKLGAAVLAARACLRSGVGLLTAHVPACGYQVLQTTVPEAMTTTDPMADYLSALPDDAHLGRYQALGIGPGLGQHADTALLLRELLDEARTRDLPTVLDADALNLLAAHPTWARHLPPRTVLTPHPKEFSRLAGESPDDFQRLDRLRAYAAETGAVVLLKGANSVVATPSGELYFNSTGNPGMATGGTGDVLTGVILALLAQGLSPLDAARLGAWAHGRAGDLARDQHGERGLLAGDLAECLGRAFETSRQNF